MSALCSRLFQTAVAECLKARDNRLVRGLVTVKRLRVLLILLLLHCKYFLSEKKDDDDEYSAVQYLLSKTDQYSKALHCFRTSSLKLN